MHADRNSPERGTSLIELLIATTLFSLVSVFMYSAASEVSALQLEQQTRTRAATNANVARARVLGDATTATSALCADASTLSLSIGLGPATLVEYYVSDGELVRWTLPPDKESLVAEDVAALDCFSFGSDGIAVDLDLGTADHPFHVFMRISDSGAVP
jgi:type II secretory pathway pseudopilin PulG